MQNPENLRVLPQADELAVMVYRLARRLPSSERFELGSQLRRAAISVGSNIAEGCGRAGDRELVVFLHYAMGSASEIAYQLRLAVKLELFTADDVKAAREQAARVQRMISRLILTLRTPDADKLVSKRRGRKPIG